MSGYRIKIVDVAAEAQRMFGVKPGDKFFGQAMPEHDWRFEVEYTRDNGATGSVVMHRGAPAEYLQAMLEREGLAARREAKDG